MRRKVLFSLLTAGLVLGLLEIGLRVAGVQPLLANVDPYVGFSSQVPLLVQKQVDGKAVMQTAPNKLRWFNAQQFPKKKSANAYRIFTVGGSTTYGRPYDDQTSFTGWLRELLAEADPSREWEVINAGGISYASYRVVRVMEELAEYEPDLFVVYTGHNEFLEERTYREVRQLPSWLRDAGALFGRTRTYAALYSALNRPSDRPSERSSNSSPSPVSVGDESPDELAEEVRTRLDGGVGPDAYQRDERLAKKILDHFRYNLSRMIDIARQSGAEIILVTPASNLADCSPFKSEHDRGLSDSERLAWQRLYDESQQAYDDQQYDVARAAVEKALDTAPHHAHTHYLHGRILQKLGLDDQAEQALVRARDEDVCPLRSLSETVAIVREVADKQHATLVDFERLVAEQSEGQIASASLFLDHVHPTIEGNRLLATALLDDLVARHVVELPESWDASADRVATRVESRVDQTARGEALRNLSKVLSWAGKKEEANRLSLQASKLIGGDAETAYLAGNALLSKGKTSEAIAKLKEALRIAPGHALALNTLGSAYLRQGDFEAATQTFHRALKLQPDLAPAHNNLGTLYQRSKETKLAIKHYEEAIRLNPRYSKAFNNLGVLLRGQGKISEAADYFRKAIAIDSNFTEAHYNLGTIFDRQGDRKSAQMQYRQSIRLNPRYGPAYYRLGMHLEDQKQWSAAIQAYRNALRPPSSPINAARRLAWILATCPDDSLRRGKVALQMARKCAAITKHADPETLSVLAAAYAETRDFDNAVRWQAKALQLARQTDKPRHKTRLDTLRSRQPLRTP